MADKKKLSEMDDEESATPTLENVENIPTSPDNSLQETPPYETSDEIEKVIADLSAPSSDEIKTPTEEAPAPTPAQAEQQPSSPNYQDLLDRYKAAQASRQSGMQGAQIMRAADIAATGLAGHGAHRAPEDLFKGMETQAELPVQNVQEEIKARPEIQKTYTTEILSDPKSDVSKLFRDTLQKIYKSSGLDIAVPETLSAAQVHDSMPNILHYMSSREIAAARKAAAQASLEGKQEKANVKEESDLDKLVVKAGEAVNPNKFGRGAMGDAQKRVNAAERVETLFKQFPDFNIPKTQTRELATAVGALLATGNASSVTQINELVPHTLIGNTMGIASWLTNNPVGLGQQKFMKLFADTAKREKLTAQNQITRAQFKTMYQTYKKVRDKRPEDFYNTLGVATGMTPEEIQSMETQPNFKGEYLEPAQKKDKNIEDYANKYFSGDYDKAKAFLVTKKGYKPKEE